MHLPRRGQGDRGRCASKEVGDVIGFRGPYGNHFPLDEFRGKDLLFVVGGIALPPLRCLIWNILDRRDEFGAVRIVYGARSVSDLVYKDELAEWEARSDVELVTTVDPGGETPDWKGKIGFVPTALEQYAPPSKNGLAFVCGPPIMIKFSMPVLEKLGFAPEQIYTTLENRMKCGVGKCGRCNIGGTYVCKEGPVFNGAGARGAADGERLLGPSRHVQPVILPGPRQRGIAENGPGQFRVQALGPDIIGQHDHTSLPALKTDDHVAGPVVVTALEPGRPCPVPEGHHGQSGRQADPGVARFRLGRQGRELVRAT